MYYYDRSRNNQLVEAIQHLNSLDHCTIAETANGVGAVSHVAKHAVLPLVETCPTKSCILWIEKVKEKAVIVGIPRRPRVRGYRQCAVHRQR